MFKKHITKEKSFCDVFFYKGEYILFIIAMFVY